jgi:phosphomethylpyrimidine synthase
VRISKEIVEFASGKAEGFERGRPVVSAALTPEQQQILARRGVLPAEELHRLARKTRKAVGADTGSKAGCHSDVVDAASAQRVHEERLEAKVVPVRVAPTDAMPGE